MADHGDSTAQSATMQAHQATWSGFKTMMTWGTVAAFLVGFGVVLLIAPK